ncbi:hemerythrin domain-containing protein [Modestobacter lapidis]|nr:hemerythrin domain-containing protein [Modestobacter lapidis]
MSAMPDAPRAAAGGAAPDTLAAEHRALHQETGLRRQRVIDALGAGSWPVAEVQALLAYLHHEVLDQAAAEERRLFARACGSHADPRARQLAAEHAGLRDAVDEVTCAATDDGRDTGRLVRALTDLDDRLGRHLRHEEEVLAGVAEEAGARQDAPHHAGWFLLSEGPVLDLDALPTGFADRVAVDRLTRLRPGEQVTIRSSGRLDRLWGLLQRRLPGEHRWTSVVEGPLNWEAEVLRRASG